MTPHLHRFARQPSARQAAERSYHPYGTPDTPMVMPVPLVLVGSAGIAYSDMHPLVMPDGRMIPATGNAQWYQLHAVHPAGRP